MNFINGTTIPHPSFHCHSAEAHEFDQISYMFGAVLSGIAPFFSTYGVNKQKQFHNKFPGDKTKWGEVINRNGHNDPRQWTYSPWFTYWFFGLCMIGIASLIDLIAFTFCPKVIVAAMGSSSIIYNVFLSKWINNEKTNAWSHLFTFIILVGCVLTVIFSSHNNEICDRDHIYLMLTRDIAVIFMVGYAILTMGIFLHQRALESDRLEAGISIKSDYVEVDLKGKKIYVEEQEPMKFTIDDEDGSDIELNEEHIKAVKEQLKEEKELKAKRYRKWESLHMFYMAFLAALFGAPTVIAYSTVGALFVSWARGDDHGFLLGPEFMFMILLVILFSYLQVFWINEAMKRYDNSLVQPIFVSSWTIWTTVLAGTILDEFGELQPVQDAMIPIGSCIILFGIVGLVKSTR